MKRSILVLASVCALVAANSLAGDAQAIYDKECAKCHGADGKGQTKMGQKLGAKDYTDAKVQEAMKDDEMAKAIKEGVKDKDGKVLMKATEDVTDEDIKALVKLIRGFKK